MKARRASNATSTLRAWLYRYNKSVPSKPASSPPQLLATLNYNGKLFCTYYFSCTSNARSIRKRCQLKRAPPARAAAVPALPPLHRSMAANFDYSLRSLKPVCTPGSVLDSRLAPSPVQASSLNHTCSQVPASHSPRKLLRSISTEAAQEVV